MTTECDRRSFLRTGAAAGVALAASGAAAAQEGQNVDYGGWFDDVGNYDGTTVDRTGQKEVTVRVGAQGNGGNFAFDPPAVHVDKETTIVWKWTGKGGEHNIVSAAGAFASNLASEAGHTYKFSFESSGVAKYLCQRHQDQGMKGAIAVGDVGGSATGGDTSGGVRGDGGTGGASGGNTTGNRDAPGAGAGIGRTTAALFGAALGLAFLSPLFFAAFLLWRYRGER